VRIGLLTTSFPRFEGDVPGQFVLGFARALAREGHRVEVLAPEPAEVRPLPRFETPARGSTGFAPVALRWVPYLRPRALQRTFYGAGVLDNLARDPRAFLGLAPFPLALRAAALRHGERWDALESHWALPCALVAGSVTGGRPHLAVLHSGDVALLERLPGRRALARRIARGAGAMLFSSRDLRARFLALLDPLERGERAGSMHVCAMGIAPPDAGPSPARDTLRHELSLSGFTLLSLGRLVPIKGLEHAIDAVAELAGVELVVAGDGPLRAALSARARRQRARVRFVGELRGAAKEAWLRAADAFVLPSVVLASGRSEGSPTSLLEAMQHGLPVIASRQGGIPDLVEHGHNGLLVPPGERGALREAIAALRDAPPSQRAAHDAAGRQTAADYEWDVLGPRLIELLVSDGRA
jgi:glycosyltransferase involved in cell wall biosynthesis